jgi:hypothetical protein
MGIFEDAGVEGGGLFGLGVEPQAGDQGAVAHRFSFVVLIVLCLV